MSKTLVLIALLGLVSVSFAVKPPSQGNLNNLNVDVPDQEDYLGEPQVDSIENTIGNFDFEDAEVVDSEQTGGQGWQAQSVEIAGKNRQGRPYEVDYIAAQAKVPGNTSSIQAAQLNGYDAQGEPFTAELAYIETDNTEIDGDIVAVNVTGTYRGEPFQVAAAQIQGTDYEGSLLVEAADIQGVDAQGEHFNLNVTNVEVVAGNGVITDTQTVTTTIVPAPKPKPQLRGPVDDKPAPAKH
jgi:hypothetical protein